MSTNTIIQRIRAAAPDLKVDGVRVELLTSDETYMNVYVTAEFENDLAAELDEIETTHLARMESLAGDYYAADILSDRLHEELETARSAFEWKIRDAQEATLAYLRELYPTADHITRGDPEPDEAMFRVFLCVRYEVQP